MDGNPAKNEFLLLIDEALDKALPRVQVDEAELVRSITLSTNTEWDMSSSIAMRLAKKVGFSPAALAEAITRNMQTGTLVASVTHLNGYINAKLNERAFAGEVISAVILQRQLYGMSKMGLDQKVIIEFPSVNPNKPWHIGHLRNALLGDAIARIFSFCSYRVEREDYIDDLGLQMAEMLWGMHNIGRKPDKKYDQFLGELYVEINKRLNEPGVQDEITRMLKSMEDVESQELKEIKGMSELSVGAQYETAFNYGISHNVLVWESDIIRERLLEHALEVLEKQGITKRPDSGKYAGCVVVGMNGQSEEGVKVLVRSNGVATYTGKDVAFHMWKLGLLPSTFKYKAFVKQADGSIAYTSSDTGAPMEFGGADIAINVIGSAQDAQQAVLREVMSLASSGRTADMLVHLSYGEVGLASGSLSGRTGEWMGDTRNYTADDLLREMNAQALVIVRESERLGEDADQQSIARRVALSAIKFEFLKIEPVRKVTFDWQRALDFNANSGPYCMYMYARASRILEGGGARTIALSDADIGHMERKHDLALLKKISECGEAVEKACRELKPNAIADYVMEVALLFGRFYETMPVLRGGEAARLRLAIVWTARQTIYNMLGLLGIETVERM